MPKRCAINGGVRTWLFCCAVTERCAVLGDVRTGLCPCAMTECGHGSSLVWAFDAVGECTVLCANSAISQWCYEEAWGWVESAHLGGHPHM
eukprot:63204-Pelagomonas_calceolata.AAC.2